MKKDRKNKAIFLDRDGTLNVLAPGEYILRASEVRLLPGAAAAVRKFNLLGYLVILITNQGVIGRKTLTESQLHEINSLLIRRVEARGGKIDAIYHCPHHPKAILPDYAVRCRCRKPEIGLVTKAVRDFSIDKRKSFFVGDTTLDILTGTRAGLKTILVKTGYGGKDKKYDVKPDVIVKNLQEAARVVGRKEMFTSQCS